MLNMEQEYRSRVVSAEDAVKLIHSGDRVLVGSGCAAPQELLRALIRRAPDLADVELVHLMTFGIAPYVDSKYQGSFRHNAFFIGTNVREAVREGRADFTPIFLSEVPALFHSKQMKLDMVMVMVTPPDKNGYCSLGIHPDIALAGIKAAKIKIAQVNRYMPRAHGDTFVHLTRFDHFVEHDEMLLELPQKPFDDTSRTIARHVASLIEDGSTLQLGIGMVPNAILNLLENRRDLGIHSEMISDGVMKLIELDVVTNLRKGLHPGKTVASFAMGTKALYDYIDDNPHFEFHQTEYVNSPRIIAKNAKMCSINSAIQVDLTGQVCADSIGHRLFSGIGGQVDFIRGAAMSPGGKPIIALPATARDGQVSRICANLEAGAGVVTSRGDVHYVVTEYGVAYLHGKTIRERAMALIEIAHPDFRAELREQALERRYVPVDWELPTESQRYPYDMEEMHEFKGGPLFVRPLRSSDYDRLMAFFYSHRPETVFGRYHYLKKHLHQDEAIRLCTLDYSKKFALAVFGEEGRGEQIVGVGRYELNDKTQLAETALVVHEDHRRRGIGRYLLERLQEYAEKNGILGFYAEFGPRNQEAIRVHKRLGHAVLYDERSKIYTYMLIFGDGRERHPAGAEENVSSEAESPVG